MDGEATKHELGRRAFRTFDAFIWPLYMQRFDFMRDKADYAAWYYFRY